MDIRIIGEGYVMNFKFNKKVSIVMLVLLLSLALVSTAFAADNLTTLKAWFGDIKIFNNNVQVQLKDKPFIVDGTTYLPVRAVGELFGKDISWNQANKHIGINDKPGTNNSDMAFEIITQKVKIVELEKKVKDLEAKLKNEVGKVSSLSDMEKKLNKDYGTSDKIDFNISLYDSKDKIEVRIYIEERYSSDRWSSWSTSKNKTYLQNITDDILKEFKDAKIYGFIQDNYPTWKVKTNFEVSTKGKVSVDSKYNDYDDYYDDIDDLEYNLNRWYSGSKLIDEIELDGDVDNIDLTVYVDYDEWNKLTNRQLKSALTDIYDDIINEFKRAEVYVYIKDDYTRRTLESFYY